jgi:hypothetical protein
MSFVHVTDYQRGDMLIENVSSEALKMGHEQVWSKSGKIKTGELENDSHKRMVK